MRHMLSGPNLAVTVGRAGHVIGQHEWDIVFCTNSITEFNFFRRGGNNLFPLYLYPDPERPLTEDRHWPAGNLDRVPNLSPQFVRALADGIKLEFVTDGLGNLTDTFGPENVFDYIYAVLNSQQYRSCYSEFLKRDFPRIPVTRKRALFAQLSGMGNRLVALHLMESPRLSQFITTFPISGNNELTRVGEKGQTLGDLKNGKGKLYINKTQYFDNVPESVWNFHIGGYQICHKRLDDRRKAGRSLSDDDIAHYHKIIVALNETIRIMKQIDEVIAAHGGWPIK